MIFGMYVLLILLHCIIIKIKLQSSCEIEDFVETHLCKLCVILRSRVLRVVCLISPFTTANPFLGTKILGFSIGRGLGARKGLRI